MNSYILHHDGKDWNLRHHPSHRVIARFECRLTALRHGLAQAYGNGAKLVLLPREVFPSRSFKP